MAEKKMFQAQAFISKLVTMEDKTIRLFVDCQEMNSEAEAMLFSLRHQPGWFLFSEQELKQEDVSNLPDIYIEKSEKHPSVRLRACLYRLWEQTDKKQQFEVFYRSKMEELITFVKKKIS